jgi:hypothetical protein
MLLEEIVFTTYLSIHYFQKVFFFQRIDNVTRSRNKSLDCYRKFDRSNLYFSSSFTVFLHNYTYVSSLIFVCFVYVFLSYFSINREIFNYFGCRPLKSSQIPDRVRRFREIRSEVYHHIKFCLQDKIEFITQVSTFIMI